MLHDFYVHVGMVESPSIRENKPPNYATYKDRIMKSVETSSSPIRVQGGIDLALQKVILPQRTISCIVPQLSETGKIPRYEVQKLQQILGGFNPTDQFRIHGEYFDRCTAEFAVQLYGLVYSEGAH